MTQEQATQLMDTYLKLKNSTSRMIAGSINNGRIFQSTIMFSDDFDSEDMNSFIHEMQFTEGVLLMPEAAIVRTVDYDTAIKALELIKVFKQII